MCVCVCCFVCIGLPFLVAIDYCEKVMHILFDCL